MLIVRILAFTFLIVCGFWLYSAKKDAGYCGIGAYNQLPFSMKSFYYNGFWFVDEYDFSILSEGISIETKNFGEILVQDIQDISYTQDIFIARMLSDNSQLLYAVIENENPNWQDVRFFNEIEFNSRYQIPNEDWIKIDLASCNTRFGHPLFENTIILFLSLLFMWIIYGAFKKNTRIRGSGDSLLN